MAEPSQFDTPQVNYCRNPFERWGLWRNPFGELTSDERARLAVVEEDEMWEQLQSPRGCLQFVGGCGFGKTTHLLVAKSRFAAEYVYFPEDGPRPKLPQTAGLLIVDEAQRMGWRRRFQMLRHQGPLIIGTHVDLSKQLTRAGFDLRVVEVEKTTTPQKLVEILNRRIVASRVCGSQSTIAVDMSLAEQLMSRFHGNLRCIEDYLFEQFQLTLRDLQPWPPAA